MTWQTGKHAITRRQALCLAGGTAGLAAASEACSSKSAGSDKELTLWSEWAKGEHDQKFVQSSLNEFTKKTGVKVNVVWKGRGSPRPCCRH